MSNFCLDKALEVSTDQEVLATVYSDWIKTKGGSPAGGMAFDVRVKTPFVGTGSLVVSVQDTADEGTTIVTRASSVSKVAAALAATAGGKPAITLTVPKDHADWFRLAYTVTGTFTAGKVTANLNTEI